jgi:hypothetical protein
MQKDKESVSIRAHFERLSGHRHHNKLHKLINVIIITICAVVAGADTYVLCIILLYSID